MPDPSPASRYLLLAIAVLMMGAALPDLPVWLAKVRPWCAHVPERVVVVRSW